MATIKTIYHPNTGEKGVEVDKLPTVKGYMTFSAYGKDAFRLCIEKWEEVRDRNCRIIPFRIIRERKVRIGHA